MNQTMKININKTIVLELNYHCNLQCIHCYIPGDEKKRKMFMRFDEAKRLLDQIEELGFQRIVITGGEPLLNPDFIKIYSYAWDKGFIISLYTNITLMTEEIKKLLILKKPALIKISLFGCDKSTYAIITGQDLYSLVYQNILYLKQEGINVAVKIPLLRQNNPKYVKEIQKKLAENGISVKIEVRILPRFNGDTEILNYRYTPEEIIELKIDNEQRSMEMFEQVHNSNKKVKDITQCIQVCQPSVINPECKLQLCFFMREYGIDLHSVLLRDAFSMLVDVMSKGQIGNESFECKDCNKQYMCMYCPGWAKTEVGAVNKKIPFLCDLIKGYEDKYISLKKNHDWEELSE